MSANLRTTPLTDWHIGRGARMVPFAGFNMPVQYGGIQEEVHTVRNAAGLFDLCHMGRLVLTGPQHVEAVDHVLSQNVAKLKPGQIRYSLICNEQGTVIDDVLVYKGGNEVHVVINASGREADDTWFREQTASFDVNIENVSDDQTMIALQGPTSKDALGGIVDIDLADLKYYRFTDGTLLGDVPALVSRTGYTGEDGFELFFAVDEAQRVWDALVAAGAVPIGLGARDVCRTEAGMALYGNEINLETTPLEADLGFGMDLEKPFIGRDALVAQRDAGIPRRLVGLAVEGRRVPREKCDVYAAGEAVGHVTSGTFSPTLERPIAMALIRRELAVEGAELEVDIRGKRSPAKVDGLPFYSRKRKKKAPGANA